MNIASTARHAAVKPQSKVAEAPAKEPISQEAVAEQADTVSISVSLPQNIMKRSVATGIGGVGGLGVAYLLGGGLTTGLALGAAALGGVAGAALSSDTVGSAVGSFMAARKEKKIQQKVAVESTRQAEQMLQERIREQAEQKFEAQWAKSGEASVEKRVEAQLAERIEAEAAPRVEEQFNKKFDAVVSARVESKMKAESGSIEAAVEARVEERIDEMVNKAVGERAETEVEERVDAAVEEKVGQALKERGEEIEGKVESSVQAAVDAEIKAKLEARKAPSSHVADLDMHYKLAKSAAQKSYAGGAEILGDGLEVVAQTAQSLASADKRLVEVMLKGSKGTDWVTPKWNNLAARSRYKALEQATLVLKKSSEAETASLNPEFYLDNLKISNNTWDSGRLFLRSGLKVMIENGDLTPSKKLLAEKAVDNEGMQYEADWYHLRNVMKLLAGQSIE